MANYLEDSSLHDLHTADVVDDKIINSTVAVTDNSATAVGAGAVSGAGYATVNAATGSGAVAQVGGGTVDQVSGHGQLISGSWVGQNAVGSPGAIQADGGAHGAFNTGHVQGVQAGGDVFGAVVGNGNQTATVLGHADGAGFGFGHSTVGVASGNYVGAAGAISGLGDAQNHSHLLAGHDTEGHRYDETHRYDEGHRHDEGHRYDETHRYHDDTETHRDHDHDHDSHGHYRPTHVVADHADLATDDHSHFFHC